MHQRSGRHAHDRADAIDCPIKPPTNVGEKETRCRRHRTLARAHCQECHPSAECGVRSASLNLFFLLLIFLLQVASCNETQRNATQIALHEKLCSFFITPNAPK